MMPCVIFKGVVGSDSRAVLIFQLPVCHCCHSVNQGGAATTARPATEGLYPSHANNWHLPTSHIIQIVEVL